MIVGMDILLADDRIVSEMSALPEWSREGGVISRTFAFPQYMAGIAFVDKVARLAEEANHHPDMVVKWRKVSISLTTHSKGGLTDNDFALARQIDGKFASIASSSGVA